MAFDMKVLDRRPGVFGLVERGPELIQAGSERTVQPPDDALAWLYAPLLAWGPLLMLVTAAYHRRRAGTATSGSTTT